MGEVRAKKSLGQHFLVDQNIAKKIVEAIDTSGTANIVEIGPGTGVLTAYLHEKKLKNFKAIEIDKESIAYLHKKYPDAENWLIEGDFLKIDINSLGEKLNFIGNLPYYISSQIFFRFIENFDKVDEVVCMIQKEVADRIAAKPGSKTYGLLSVLLQTYFDIEYLFTVHEHCFQPAPRVKSAVIRLKRNERKSLPCSNELYKKIVKGTFNQRRKTIRNSLKSIFIFLEENKFLQNRPEQLSVDDFIELTVDVERQL